MKALAAIVAALVAAGLASAAWIMPLGPTASAEDASAEAASASAADPLGNESIVWEGFLRMGVADRFAHTKETEPVVAPLARMGFDVEVPEGAESLRFEMTWPAGVAMHLMAHAPHDDEMPTYMSGWPDSGHLCVEVPADEVAGGVWKVMAHARDTARDLEFEVVVHARAPDALRVLDGWHGHAADEGMDMTMEEPLDCGAGA